MSRLSNPRIAAGGIYIGLAMLTLGIFLPAVRFDFVNYDDPDYVFQNSQVLRGLTWDNLVWAFTTGAASNWHPLTWLSLMLDRECFGPGPAGFHFTNVILHTVNTLLLFTVLRIMTKARWASAFAAALFAVHPLHVESVAWIAERKDVLSTLFWMLTLWSYYRYTQKGTAARYLLTLLVFALGLMAKPMLVTLPLILVLLDYWPLQRLDPFHWNHFLKSLWEKIPFFLLTVLACTATILAQFRGDTIANLTKIPLSIRLSNAVLTYWRYLAKMVWPADLSFFYPYPADTGKGTWWTETAAASIGLILATILLIFAGRKYKYLFTGWLWYLVTLVPVIGLMHVGSQAYANRYTYIPLTGIFILAAWGFPALLAQFRYRNTLLTGAALLILALFSFRTVIELGYWKNSITLCRRAIEVTQRNFMAEILLGQALYQEGHIDEAITHFQESIRLQPDNGYAHYNLGLIAVKQARLDDAVRYFQQATRIKPTNDSAWCSLGFALLRQGKPKEALSPLREAVRLNPASEISHFHLACVLEQLQNHKEAVVHYRQSIRLKPDNPVVLNGLAWLLATSGQSEIQNPLEAIRLAETACRLTEHKDPILLDTLAAACAAAGRFSDAVQYQKLALEILETSKNPAIQADFQKRLALYESGQAYQTP